MLVEENLPVKYTSPLKVLIVEDNTIDMRVLKSMLMDSNAYASEIKTSDTLASALKLLREYPFDVVVLDLNVLDSNGEHTLIEMRAQNPEVPIVVNTGVYEDEIGLRTLRLGAQDFLVKGKYTAYMLNKALHYAIERKRLENQLRDAYGKLKEAQAQLIQSEKMKVIGGLASGVAHEVRNPLSTILYGTTYIKQNLKDTDDNIKIALENVQEATSRANDIISDLLDFSRLSHLKKSLSCLPDVIDKALTLTRHEIDKKKIKVKLVKKESLPEIYIDANRVEQVLINVILNAVRAMNEGGALAVTVDAGEDMARFSGHLHFMQHEGLSDGGYVICTIEDNGQGLEQTEIDKLFDPFYTTHRAKGGVGLGLFVSKGIMESHKGQILIDRSGAGGAVVTLLFPQDAAGGRP